VRVLSLVFPGFCFIDLAGPLQAFSVMPGFQSQYVWRTAGQVVSDIGVDVRATHDFDSCWADPDILFVPGNTNALFDLLTDKPTLSFLADRGARARWVTSVCNGSLLLGAAGLLNGYRAGSYWYSRKYLELYGAIPDPSRVVIDRNRATGGGMTAGVDFGIAMVGQIVGPEFGRVVELLFEYAPSPPFGTGRPELADAATVAAATKILQGLMPVEQLRPLSGGATPMKRNLGESAP